jgi:hypothetical protein
VAYAAGGAPVWPVASEHLEAALTCFPATERLEFAINEPLAPAEESRLVELLRRHGGTLKRVEMCDEHGFRRSFSFAVRAGALPNLTSISLSLGNSIDREILSGGMLPLLEEVYVTIKPDDERQMAMLGQLRSHPRLQWLELQWFDSEDFADSDDSEEADLPPFIPPSLTFPPFIPPSLKTLSLRIGGTAAALEWVFRQLPSMLQASGANLEEIWSSLEDEPPAGCGAALAQVFRTCSSTLKTVRLMRSGDMVFGGACASVVAAGLTSCCATLEALHCPLAVFSALPATGPAFPRLTELFLLGGENDDVNVAPPTWGAMTNGRLPALSELLVGTCQGFLLGGRLEGEGGGLGGHRVARALEAVAGTLTKLTLMAVGGEDAPAGACYELGAAIGKLRRLRYLHLDFISDGRDYHAVGRGVAASGACPELLGIRLSDISRNFKCSPTSPA